MKVILTEKVPSLGSIGEVVNVSAGYARNFLIPGQKAVLADEGNTKQVAHMNKLLAKKVEEEKAEAVAVQKKVNGVNLEFVKRVGSNGKLFGTVTTSELSKELEAKGITVERRLLHVETPIKGLGTFNVKAKLFAGVEANFTVNVVIDPAQAEEMKKKQEEAALKKQADALAAKEEVTEEDATKVELTEEQKLRAEADALLKSY